MDIGSRLRHERKRIQLSQDQISEVCCISRRSYIHYENGTRLPDSIFLAELSKHGGDIQYIVTGIRSSNFDVINPQEDNLLHCFRSCSAQAREIILQSANLFSKYNNAE